MTEPTKNLGRLEKVDLRKVWTSESADFTPWLAMPENLALLGDTIGVELELEAQEKDVGPFRADILCKDTANDNWVLIENQLDKTDHTHLGQIITYGAGLDAVTVVWVAERFTDEHRAALDWLNEKSGGNVAFFGLEIELWRIGDSPVAPKFNVVCSPNDWTEGGIGPKKLTPSPAKALQVEFWTAFREYVQTHGATFKPTKPLPQHWMNISIGRSGFKLLAIASMWDTESGSYEKHELRSELELADENAKRYFAQLLPEKDQIEAEVGEPLVWYNPDNKRVCRVYLRRSGIDLHNHEQWPNYHEWLKTKLEVLRKAFTPRVKLLTAEGIDDPE